MDPRELERDAVRRAHEEHIALMVRDYHAAGNQEASLQALLDVWRPGYVHAYAERPEPYQLLQKLLRTHIREECRLRSVYCPSSMQVVG